MPTYNPKQLGEPEVIREINPTVLFAFLQPFEGYLRSRGLVIKKEGRIDNSAIEKMVDILTNPTMKTPQALLNAVFYVEEMATPSAADLLLNAAQQAGMPFDEEGEHSLADIVMQVWLFDSKIVEAQHAWHTWKTPRRMECFQPANLTGVAPIAITEERLSGYVFQRKGKHRMLAFNSEIEITAETNGTWYIEQLLAKPNVAFRCTHLESLLVGMAEETSTGSIGEVVDMQTLKGYRDRLLDIDEELEEASSFNDPARQEKLGDERQAILDQIKSAQGIGGRIRHKFDAERSRKTVCKAISRSIEAIENVHPELGLHLHKSINLGLEVSYFPDIVIDWLF